MYKVKWISIVGLCLVAMAAFGAMAASSASAGEYGVCLKTARVAEGKVLHYTGKWKDAACERERQANGEYEWYPGRTGIGRGAPVVTAEAFEYKGPSTSVVLRSAAGTITCGGSVTEGAILGAQYNVEKTVFNKCTLSVTKGKCTGVDDPQLKAGEIGEFSDTYLLDHGTKGPSGLEPKELEVWNASFASEGYPYYPYQAIFECAPGVLFRVGGQLSGVVTPVSTMTPKWTVASGEGKGEQDLVSEYSENGGLTWEPTGPNVLTVTASYTTKSDRKIEVRECNEKGAVSEGKGAFPCEVSESNPAFTVEKLQEIKGSKAGFTTSELTGKIGQTVDYEIIVKNTGNVSLKFGKLSDANCTSIAPSGEETIAVGGEETYTCHHELTAVGSYSNEASDTGTPPEGPPDHA